MVEGEGEVVAKERTMEITDTRTSDDDEKVDRNASSLKCVADRPFRCESSRHTTKTTPLTQQVLQSNQGYIKQ